MHPELRAVSNPGAATSAISGSCNPADRRGNPNPEPTSSLARCGRKCYDDSIPYWDENGPTGPLKLPLFVVTHRPLLASHSTGIYHAAGSIPDAVKQAKSAAGGKDVSLMGGADVFRQALAGGLVDEIELHIVPVLFGAGTRLFDTMPNQITLEPTSMLDTPLARHIAYRIVK